MKTDENIPGSFRDPSGFLFREKGRLYRQINDSYREDYDLLMSSGLYQALIEASLLIPHKEADPGLKKSDQAYKIIEPEMINFISYPYEWAFSQLKDAALTTLKIHQKAIEFGMSLKDASAYNIQFRHGKPIFIDTLSFEKYREGEPWVAYKQFCQHFLAPLALISYTDIRLNQLSRVFIDGAPLDLVSSLLPFKTNLKFSLLTHIHLHAKSQKFYSDKPVKKTVKKGNFSQFTMLALIDNLAKAVRKLTWQPKGTEWGDYYENTNYSSDSFQRKREMVGEFLAGTDCKTVWDLGANTGLFSQIAADQGIPTVSFDIDPAAVEKNYRRCKGKKETNILPLLQDLTNPSASIGWQNRERMSFSERGPADVVFALALIHHIAISNNVPLSSVAQYFSSLCQYLIIEFVPKSDSQVKILLTSREDIFPDYHEEGFEKAFRNFFTILKSEKIPDTERTLYLMKKASSS